MTNLTESTGTNSPGGPELLVELRREVGRPLLAQLEEGLREAVRSGRLAADATLPPTRTLAADLGVSRRLVVDAYAQLLAEGYLVARRGAGTYVAESAASTAVVADLPEDSRAAFDFFPGSPDLAGFPRLPWLRALRQVLSETSYRSFGYPEPQGATELRRVLADYLGRVRGVVADPATIVVCSGIQQGLVLLARALGRPHVAMEDPGLPSHVRIMTAHGARLSRLPVDDQGARTGELLRIERELGRLDAAFVTPAHQSPTGVALAPGRRSELLDWADGGRVVLEDDYDAEYRYDRAPISALQGLAPDRVVYMGSTSKTLAPALRLGWLVLPAHLVQPVVDQRRVADNGAPTLDQLALARLIESGAYDRHLRQARRRYRARRDALVEAVARHLPEARVTGLAAGLHAIVRLGRDVDGPALEEEATRQSLAVWTLGSCFQPPRVLHDGLVLGYGNLSEPAIEEGIGRLAAVLRTIFGRT